MRTFYMMPVNATTRVHWVHDEMHETRGSYGYETEAATKEAEDEELAKLESGEWVVLGAIVQHQCAHCGEWKDGDDLWGIVIEPDHAKLAEFAEHNLTLGVPA